MMSFSKPHTTLPEYFKIQDSGSPVKNVLPNSILILKHCQKVLFRLAAILDKTGIAMLLSKRD